MNAGSRTFEAVLVSRSAKPEKAAEIVAAAKERGVEVRKVADEELETEAKTHGGIVALCGPKPLLSADELYRLVGSLRSSAFLVLADGVDDPRNFGYLLRSAEAFGVHALLLRRREMDMDSTAVSRASSGSFERLPVVLVESELEEARRLRRMGLILVGCTPAGRQTIYESDMTKPLILAIGGEKRGLSNAVRSRCDFCMRIPTKPGASSLAMTQAAAIAFAETARQRSATE